MALTRIGLNQSINLASNVTGTLPTANGGTAITSGFINGGSLTMADQWRLNTAFTGNANPIASNWERNDTAPALSYFGSQMTESSGVFSFPSTGIYLVELFAMTNANGADNIIMEIQATIDNSTYVPVAEGVNGVDGALQTLSCSSLIDVTNISNVKIKFNVQSLNTNSYIDGNTSQTNTGFTFIRLGDT